MENGKEYNNGKLIFEGEYVDNQKYKGKNYINNKLEFEGEYKNGEKWNGNGFDKYGNIIYALVNGNGSIKEYNDDGTLQFEGE